MDHENSVIIKEEAGGRVIARKGATFYAASVGVCHLCKALLGSVGTNLTISTMMHGEYGVDDVCLSVINVVNKEGILGKILAPMTDAELAQLQKSANTLKDVIRDLDI